MTRPTPTARWVTGAPRWMFTMLVLVTAAVTLVSLAVPGGLFTPGILAGLGWLALGLVWLVRLVLAATVGERVAGLRRQWRRWLVGPVLLAATATASVTQLPLHTGLALAANPMRAYAENPAAPVPTRVGPYPVAHAERIPGGARFAVDGAGFLDRSGFAFSPDGPPPGGGGDTYDHLRGPWYVWRETW